MFSLKDVIEMAIQIEKNGEKVYRKALEKVSDLSLVSLLQHLADEEVRHIQWFSELKNKTTETGDDPLVEKAGKSLLQRILGDQSFSLADADLSSTKDMTSLLATAIEFEKDTVLFYELIRSFVQDPDVSDQLDTIIEEEKQHVQDLQRFMETSQTMGEKAIPKGAGNR